jgi:hypothetical protein
MVDTAANPRQMRRALDDFSCYELKKCSELLGNISEKEGIYEYLRKTALS